MAHGTVGENFDDGEEDHQGKVRLLVTKVEFL
jgi:hypothetical protein